jgi:hypothetical protein
MARQPKKETPPERWELDDSMREHFLKRGWDLTDQFLINLMMRGRDHIKKIPGREERLRMYDES